MLGEVQSIPVELGSLADIVRGFIPCEWGKAERDRSLVVLDVRINLVPVILF